MKGKALTLPCAAVLLGLALTGCGQQSSQADPPGACQLPFQDRLFKGRDHLEGIFIKRA